MERGDVERTVERAMAHVTGALKATFPEGEDVLDPNAVASSIEVVRSRLHAYFSSRRTSRLLRLARHVFGRLVETRAFREYAREQRDAQAREEDARVREYPLGPELLELLLAADARVRHGGMVAFFELYPLLRNRPEDLAALSGLGQFESLRGEHRAVEVVRTFVPVCERLYLKVARGVRRLELFADGKEMGSELSLGNVLSAARDRNGRAASLLDLDAARIRNAAAHSHYAYFPADDAVELWNRNGWRLRVSVPELEVRLNDIFAFAVSTAPQVMAHYQQKYVVARGDIAEAFLDLLPALLRDDLPDRKARGERFIAVLEREFTPLMRALDPAWDERAGDEASAPDRSDPGSD